MSSSAPEHVLQPFLAAADRAAATRPDVDADLARELMAEAATVLHNSLALDDLDEHDREAVVTALATDLTSVDPGAAVRARAADMTVADPALHEPDVARAAYLVTVRVLGL